MNCLLFDLDGVLWDTKEIHSISFHRALKNFKDIEFNYSEYAGMKTKDVFRDLSKTYPILEKHISLLTCKKQDYANYFLNQSPPINKQLDDFLKLLSKSYRLALVSSSSKRNINIFLNNISSNLFEVVVSGDDIIKAKPLPDIYIYACLKLKINPKNAFVFEDSLKGVLSAQAAGCRVFGFEGTIPKKKLLELGVERAFSNLLQIKSYLNEQNYL